MHAIVIDGNQLTLQKFKQVVEHYVPVHLASQAYERMNASRKLIEDLIQQEKTVYGITTGFGKFSDTLIPTEQAKLLQINLLKSHACGVGEFLPESTVRGMLLLRANALAKGASGIRPIVVERLIEFLNKKITPVVPSQGSLGASGDLAPLAHLVLPIVGLGEIWENGQRVPAEQVLAKHGITPLELEAKEGLALINGTQLMCSLLAESILFAEKLLLSADLIAALTVQALRGIPTAFHPLLQQVRGHHGQIVTARNLQLLLDESALTTQPGEMRVQDAYSLRCIPQVHGASKDAYRHVRKIVETELNAATDNPLVFPELEEVISGGNFHGQPLALAADYLTIAMAEIANISERRIERLVNPQLSGLPAFLTPEGGLNSGYMIFQYVAASLVSENKVLSHPASVDSIPSSANQEDHVSMGAVAARKCKTVLENVAKVLAIEYLCACQALEFTEKKMSKRTKRAYDLLRSVVPPLKEDRMYASEIEFAVELIRSGNLAALFEGELEI